MISGSNLTKSIGLALLCCFPSLGWTQSEDPEPTQAGEGQTSSVDEVPQEPIRVRVRVRALEGY